MTGRDLQILQQNQVSENREDEDDQNLRENPNVDPLYQEV
jgi:hypothetical protein